MEALEFLPVIPGSSYSVRLRSISAGAAYSFPPRMIYHSVTFRAQILDTFLILSTTHPAFPQDLALAEQQALPLLRAHPQRYPLLPYGTQAMVSLRMETFSGLVTV